MIEDFGTGQGAGGAVPPLLLKQIEGQGGSRDALIIDFHIYGATIMCILHTC